MILRLAFLLLLTGFLVKDPIWAADAPQLIEMAIDAKMLDDEEIDFSKLADFYLLVGKVAMDDTLTAISEPAITNLAQSLADLNFQETDQRKIFAYNFLEGTISTIYRDFVQQLTQLGFLKIAPSVLAGNDILDDLTWTLTYKQYIPLEKVIGQDPAEILHGKIKIKRFLTLGPKVTSKWLSLLKNATLMQAKTLSEAISQGLSAGVAVSGYNMLANNRNNLWLESHNISYEYRDFFKFMFMKASSFIARQLNIEFNRNYLPNLNLSGYFTIKDGELYHLCFSSQDEHNLIEKYLDNLPYLNRKEFMLLANQELIELGKEIYLKDKNLAYKLAHQILHFTNYMCDEALSFTIYSSGTLIYKWFTSYPAFKWVKKLGGDDVSKYQHNFFQRSYNKLTYTAKIELVTTLRENLLKPALKKGIRFIKNKIGIKIQDDLKFGELYIAITPCEKGYCFVKSTQEKLSLPSSALRLQGQIDTKSEN